MILFLEANRLAMLRSYRDVRMSVDTNNRRSINTIIELSPNKVHGSESNIELHPETGRRSLSPIAQSKDVSYKLSYSLSLLI